VAVVGGFLFPRTAGAQLTMTESGFTVTDLGSSVGAKGITCSPGGIWGDYVYIADSGGSLIERIDFYDVPSLFATLPGGSFPVGIDFGPGPGANFGNFLYIANYASSTIVKIDPAGTVFPFSAAVPMPGDAVFDPSGAYGNELFVTTAYAGPIYKVDEFGVAAPWAAFQALYMKFGPGGAWGTGMYSTSQTAVGLVTVDIAGVPTNFCTGFTSPEGFDWAFGYPFDGDMFAADVTTNEVWRVKSDGTRTLFATMPGAADVAFCNGALYLVGFHGGCYKVEPEGPVAVAFRSIGARAVDRVVEVTWDVAADEEIHGFNVYRQDGDAADLRAIADNGAVGPDARTFVDTSVQPGATYGYVVGVVTSEGSEIRSAHAMVTARNIALTIEQNVPNPFNPTTSIAYELPEAGNVRLSVYDAQGRFVVDLERGFRSSGAHTVTWDGRDALGQSVASGVYFYRLTSDERSLTKKLVLLK
jgi:hypothetical protein